jgi:8-oxo-dGTP pyrophosphatase MutT (NUDIX family)
LRQPIANKLLAQPFQTVMKLQGALLNIVRRGYGQNMSRGGEVAVPVQSGALPWRVRRSKKAEKAEVLLVTGRRSGRWMIPKGWPVDGKSMADSAAQEAFEEAGIKGKVDPQPIGTFRHVKQHLLFGRLEVDIQVHTMAVKRELGDWPERGERTRKWFRVEEAAQRVDSEELKVLIVKFGESLKEQATPAK